MSVSIYHSHPSEVAYMWPYFELPTAARAGKWLCQDNNSSLHINLNSTSTQGNEPVFIDVLNALGQLIGRYEGSNQSAVISVKELMSGTYMVTVRQGSESASAQFVVSK